MVAKRPQVPYHRYVNMAYLPSHIPTYRWLIFMVHVGKYTSPMDGMGSDNSELKVDSDDNQRLHPRQTVKLDF